MVDADGHPVSSSTERTNDEAGALWNFLMVEEDRSHGIHNPQYARDLLQSSIDYFVANPPPAN